jgi:hypothetical protein
MDIKAERLALIAWLSELTDEGIIARIKSLKEAKTSTEDTFFQTNEAELVYRAKASMKDIEEGKTRNVEELKKDLENWKNQASM